MEGTQSLVLSAKSSGAPAAAKPVKRIAVPGGDKADEPTVAAMEAMAAHVAKIFDRNSQHRRISGRDERLMKCLRMVRREYSPEEMADFRAKGIPAVYMPIADTKRRAAMALVGDIFANPGDKPWSLAPTPVPAMREDVTKTAIAETMADWLEYVQVVGGEPPPPEAVAAYAATKIDEVYNLAVEEAKSQAERMERKVHDQMVEGKWSDAFSEYVDLICTYGTAVIMGPLPRIRRRKEAVISRSGMISFKVVDKLVLEWDAVSPWDCFPSPGAKSIDDGALCIRVRFAPEDLRRYSKAKGRGTWRIDVVNEILEENPMGGIRVEIPNDIERRRLESDGVSVEGDDCVLEGIKFFGEVRGFYLHELKIFLASDGRVIEEADYYEVECITVANKIVFCRVIDEELGRPLCKGVFYQEPGSWWGESAVEKMEGTQKICNAAVRDLVVNMAQASGPQTVIKDISRLDPSCSLSQSPWKVWIFKPGRMGENENPLHMFQPGSNASELLKVFDWGMRQTDLDTGIPAYTYGSNIAAGAGRTASGLAMLTEAASRGIKMVVGQTDANVVRRQVKMLCDWNMLYEDDNSIKGDLEVNPSGVMGLILREQESNRRRSFLQLTANPLDAQIITAEGRAVILREEVKGLGINADDVIPSKAKLCEIDEMRKAQEAMALEQQAMAGQQQAAEGQAQQGQEQLPQQPGQQQVEHTRMHPQQRAMQGLSVRSQQNNVEGF